MAEMALTLKDQRNDQRWPKAQNKDQKGAKSSQKQREAAIGHQKWPKKKTRNRQKNNNKLAKSCITVALKGSKVAKQLEAIKSGRKQKKQPKCPIVPGSPRSVQRRPKWLKIKNI